MFKNFVRDGELRRWAPWIGAVLLILLAVALITSMEGVCWDKSTADAAKINEAAGCFEFWFNRYQQIIGAAATLAAGWLAFAGAMRQARGTETQIKLLRKQMFSESASRYAEAATYTSSIHVLMRRAVESQSEVISLFAQVQTQAQRLMAAERDDGVEPSDATRSISGNINKSLNALSDSSQEGAKLLEQMKLPHAAQEAAQKFFEAARKELDHLKEAKTHISRPLSKNNIWDIRLKSDMREIYDVLARRERDVLLSEATGFQTIGNELKRLRKLRDDAAVAAEPEGGQPGF